MHGEDSIWSNGCEISESRKMIRVSVSIDKTDNFEMLVVQESFVAFYIPEWIYEKALSRRFRANEIGCATRLFA
jgi:hypothetical protein